MKIVIVIVIFDNEERNGQILKFRRLFHKLVFVFHTMNLTVLLKKTTKITLNVNSSQNMLCVNI